MPKMKAMEFTDTLNLQPVTHVPYLSRRLGSIRSDMRFCVTVWWSQLAGSQR